MLPQIFVFGFGHVRALRARGDVDRVARVVKRAAACLPVLGTQNCISHQGNSIKMPVCLGMAVSIRRKAPGKRDSRNGWSAAGLEFKAACAWNLGYKSGQAERDPPFRG